MPYFSGKNTGVGCHFLLQGIFLTQQSNLHLLQLLHWQAIPYHWATWEAPIINRNQPIVLNSARHPPLDRKEPGLGVRAAESGPHPWSIEQHTSTRPSSCPLAALAPGSGEDCGLHCNPHSVFPPGRHVLLPSHPCWGYRAWGGRPLLLVRL